MADSWKTVALVLAERMETHAFCPDRHQPPRPSDCPFCGDLVAYRRFQAKVAEGNRAGVAPTG